MKVVSWTIVKNDVYYIDMALRSVMPYVQGIYIQDQFSDDGTWEVIQQVIKENPNVSIMSERINTGRREKFALGYDERYYRSLALERAEKLFDPDFLLKLDADEIYTPYFFGKIKELENRFISGELNVGKWEGTRFINLDHVARSKHALFIQEGVEYYDPHEHLWARNIGVRYFYNPWLVEPIGHSNFLHSIPCPANGHKWKLIWIPGICQIHLHRTFGPKSIAFWKEGGDIFDENQRPIHIPTMAPMWYANSINMGNSLKVDFEWPDYVLQKWNKWGIW